MRRPTPPSNHQNALKALQARERELVEFTRELVATPSPNPPGDERRVAELLRQAMDRLGYSSVRSLARSSDRPNVIGEIGLGRPVLMLNGHIDTKPPGDETQWQTGPYDPVVRDGVLYGLGSTDMKAAVAAMVYAGAALGELDALPGVLRIVLSADEEAGSRFGVRFLASQGLRADAVVVTEPTGFERPWEYVSVASRGMSAFHVRTAGTQMHSSLSDRVRSVNASVKLAKVLTRMAEEFRPRHPDLTTSTPTVNLGVTLQGGVFFGVYPGAAEFGVDVRTVPGMTLEDLQADVEGFLERLRREDPDLQVAAEWVPELSWAPPSSIPFDHPIVEAARWAAREVLGHDVPPGTMPAFTDGTHWHLAGIPTIPAFGPGSLLFAHQPNEHVGLDEIVQASRIYALMSLRFLEQS